MSAKPYPPPLLSPPTPFPQPSVARESEEGQDVEQKSPYKSYACGHEYLPQTSPQSSIEETCPSCQAWPFSYLRRYIVALALSYTTPGSSSTQDNSTVQSSNQHQQNEAQKHGQTASQEEITASKALQEAMREVYEIIITSLINYASVLRPLQDPMAQMNIGIAEIDVFLGRTCQQKSAPTYDRILWLRNAMIRRSIVAARKLEVASKTAGADVREVDVPVPPSSPVAYHEYVEGEVNVDETMAEPNPAQLRCTREEVEERMVELRAVRKLLAETLEYLHVQRQNGNSGESRDAQTQSDTEQETLTKTIESLRAGFKWQLFICLREKDRRSWIAREDLTAAFEAEGFPQDPPEDEQDEPVKAEDDKSAEPKKKARPRVRFSNGQKIQTKIGPDGVRAEHTLEKRDGEWWLKHTRLYTVDEDGVEHEVRNELSKD